MPSEDASDRHPTSLYIGRRLRLPPLAAQSAADRHRLDLAASGAPSHAWIVRLRSSQLVLGGSGRVSRLDVGDAYRRWFGWLAPVVVGLPAAVELELTPWSATCCEVGLRPASAHVARWAATGQRRYLELGVEMVDHLCRIWERLAFESVMDAFGSGWHEPAAGGDRAS